jgi:AraC-like DNA-binding protein
VASRTGYSSDVSFSRSFKRYFGLTPSEFRNCQSRYEADSQQVSIGSHPAFAFEV